ncbi:MAG TPA: NAD(P)(+) transhydrogenase (Re/Si-specific) subunit beta [Saprospiraceae bacterium]|nr:NAD(P)(+) transhydrogenase (Re/Si-specific) subunit beta [Saprospiraceae bacterium]HMQ82603.1 NAD(P)(+) transhydrogenase (Re/Si-specific) subunit beta [Saprospiraceae bacterium]
MALEFFVNLCYLLGAIGFVWGLRLLSSPDSARRGNILAGIGMGLAIVAAMVSPMSGASNNYGWIVGGMIIGGLIGYLSAKRIKMTAMPQMVSVFNGLGGACAVVLAYVELIPYYATESSMSTGELGMVMFALLIGGVSFTGSLLAFGKLEGIVSDNALVLPKHHIVNIIMMLASFGLGAYLTISGQSAGIVLGTLFMVLALIYGVSFVVPIGGADMPVVISLLNSFTGLSAAATGLIYNNQFMLVGGILVGASGTILTVLMCNAMNRSLLNVLIGGFGGGGATAQAKARGEQVAKEVSLNDAAIMLYYSRSVMVVPGYGLAVAQAQKVCKELDDLLESNGVDVKYAIHPVAGRMPGHMNVLLAEADVPYPKLLDLEDANDALKNTDVAVIVGANDVVNPAAEDDPGSPIYGMPVLKVWEAKNVIVIKRSMSAGYAGIQNQLFFHERNRMLFGDAKAAMGNLVTEIKGLG